jgi:hypothetical protein
MSDRYKGAILSPTAPTVTPQSAGGIYTLSQQTQYQGQGVWPTAANNPLTNSLRFRQSANAYLNRTQGTPTTATKWTYSYWVKRGIIGGSSIQTMISGNNGAGSGILFYNDKLWASSYSGGYQWNFLSAAVYRDPSAWYHIVVAYDSTQATDTNRVKIYVNNVQLTAFTTDVGATTYPSLNSVGFVGGVSGSVRIGLRDDSFYYFDGYLAEMYFVDGQQLTPSSFGTTNASGIWQPIPYTGTYGANGFYLPFTDNSALTTSSNVGLGKDFSGNGNYWVTNNISITAGSTYDSMKDVPTNTNSNTANYATLNPLCAGLSGFAFWGNLYMSAPVASTWYSLSSTMALSGKIYFEVSIFSGSGFNVVGVTQSANGLSTYVGNTATSYGYDSAGNKNNNGIGVAYGASWVAGDIIGVAFDADALTLTFYKNNVSQGLAYTVSAGQYFAGLSTYNQNITINFGQRPFSYTPPTGFYPLNTYNLPTPTILDGDQYMDATLYTGNGGSLTVTNSGSMQPDFVWVKSRSTGSTNHLLEDVIRGTKNSLISNGGNTELARGINAFLSNGFSFNDDAAGDGNVNGQTYVGWQWKANGAGSSNTAGTITSTVSANTTSGFSIVTFTGNGSTGTVGHGLGVAPSMIIQKPRNATGSWATYHASLGAGNAVWLNLTDASASYPTVWNSTAPTSSVYSVGSYMGTSTYVAYCFAQVAGYSAFGSYTGNGSNDGPFIYTGFRPRYIMWKASSAAYNWQVIDTSRNTYNVTDALLQPNASSAESAGGGGLGVLDILSNGFKLRSNYAGWNDANTYIYMAFAENPFKIARAR